ICASGPHLPLYGLSATGLHPTVCSGLGARGSPIYSAGLFPSCHLPYPGGLNGCSCLLLPRPHWPSPFLAQARHPHRHHRRFSGDRVTRLAKFTLCYGPKGLLALHRPRRLRSSFHLPSHLQEMSNITTRANQPIPATGLSPVRPSSIMGCKPSREDAKNATNTRVLLIPVARTEDFGIQSNFLRR